MKAQKTRQERIALIVAMYVLWKNGHKQPAKRQVLNFIRMRHLVQFPDQELQKRWATDTDTIWENDIAWRRKDLFEDGPITSPELGRWSLSEAGVAKIEVKRADWLRLSDPEVRKAYLDAYDYITPELFSWI